MPPALLPWFLGIWLGLLAVWVVTALRMKPLETRGTKHAEWTQWVALALAVALAVGAGGAILSRRIIPPSDGLAYMGLVLAALGCGFAVWARLTLGRNWSVSPTIRQGHALIRRGPYRLARHPIYTGILTGVLGTMLASGRLRVVVAMIVLTTALIFKIRTEEALLREQFGVDYERYRREVKRLIPFVW